jgi:uncharacterized protein (TIGR03435 family)
MRENCGLNVRRCVRKKGLVPMTKHGVKMLLVAGWMCTAAVALGQAGEVAPTAVAAVVKLPEWDVVSIKPVQTVSPQTCTEGGGMMPRPDGLHIFCLPLSAVIKFANGIWQDARIFGMPDWCATNFYNIDAKVSGDDVAAFGKLNNDQRNLMMQALLAERFKLKVHHETRELPIYAMVVAKGGPKLTVAKPDEPHPMLRMKGKGEFIGVGIALDALPIFLSHEAGRTVVDKTGLTGKYDFDLQFTPLQGATAESTAPSIFTALEEELGLKLESQKAPMDVVVVDHIEEPTEN